ncbi:hypothetical protein B0T20DRAFT_167143 [Sordaria brevicollis]|uniref:Uncharacterized protein n=1 Tax=Sordaria brevicollis TaxID=83679 RepID=A0AAE0UD37_SORBR|nr:hypothetical protein B0T20DRAFT_167143 [Sordaria brevicollis]
MADYQGNGQYLPVNNQNASGGDNGQPANDDRKQLVNEEVLEVPDQETHESQAQPPAQNSTPASNHPMQSVVFPAPLTVPSWSQALPSGPVAQSFQQSPSTGQPTTPILPSPAPQQTVTNSPASASPPAGQPGPSNLRKHKNHYSPEFKADIVRKIRAGVEETEASAFLTMKKIATESGVCFNTLRKWWTTESEIPKEVEGKSDIIQFIQQNWTFKTDRQAILAHAAENFGVRVDDVSRLWDEREDPGGFGIKEKVNSFLRENGTDDLVLADAVLRFDIPLKTVLSWSRRGIPEVTWEVMKFAVIELRQETDGDPSWKKRACGLLGISGGLPDRIMREAAERVEQNEREPESLEEHKWERRREEVLGFLRKEKEQGNQAYWRRTCEHFGIPYSILEGWWRVYRMKAAVETWDQRKEEVLKFLRENQDKYALLSRTSDRFSIPYSKVDNWWEEEKEKMRRRKEEEEEEEEMNRKKEEVMNFLREMQGTTQDASERFGVPVDVVDLWWEDEWVMGPLPSADDADSWDIYGGGSWD